MPDTTPDPAWATEQLVAAQEGAVRWADEAEQTALAAAGKEDYATSHASTTYLREAVADARQEAQALRGRSAEASRLAEMWARVAHALQPSQAPGNGEPVLYDLNVALAPQSAAEALESQLLKLRERRPKSSS
ncbi:hypothetical protein ABZT17_12065 [Streptomyces sp. NPDC005648]|uniref:hypothetical protein n=1 Tax=Streptomyces sp. NPDC005648 TaxID=3157044 RepID=UPI0033A9CCD6